MEVRSVEATKIPSCDCIHTKHKGEKVMCMEPAVMVPFRAYANIIDVYTLESNYCPQCGKKYKDIDGKQDDTKQDHYRSKKEG